MSKFSYVFVAFVFTLLGASFLASTGSIVYEFWNTELVSILTSNSYLFVFFPTLGIVALAAFYIPAVVFTDIYVSHADAGWFRLTVGTVAAIGLAIFFADHLDQTKLRAVWEASPQALADELQKTPRCLDGSKLCVRPALQVIRDLREKSLGRVRVSPFIRTCTPDALMEPDPERALVRYCFPAGEMLDADRCCKVGREFAANMYGLWSNQKTRSDAAKYDRWLLPFKAFFVIVIMLIGILLIAWKQTLRLRYAAHLTAMERGLQIGAAAMLLWPVMDYAYQQTSDVLYGPASRFPLRLSLVIVPWALLLTFYFADKVRIELARLVQIVGSVVSGVAILRYQDISDWSSKLVGPGASELNFVVLLGLSVIMLVMLLIWLRKSLSGEEEALEAGDGSSPMT